jgi:hypothetical protein
MFYLCYWYLFTYIGIQHDFHTSASSEAGTTHPSGAPGFIPGF